MSDTLYFSRARLRRDASVRALWPLLVGDSIDSTTSHRHTGHHLVWSLFAEQADQPRDFLWREMEKGTYLILSSRPPVDRHGLFELPEPKLFEPVLEKGNRLQFSLRANAVVRRRTAPDRPPSKHDVVFDALRNHAADQRAAHRLDVVRQQGFAWLERQARKAGFGVREQNTQIDRYQQHRISRRATEPMSFSTIDFDGVLTVDRPDQFIAAIAHGFGSAKAYGCGLMLLRRA